MRARARLDPAPVNVTLFGSFARGDDDAASDIDVVVVRPTAIGEDDPTWAESIARWEAHVRRISGNAVNRIEVAEDEVAKLMKSRRPLWQAIRREGIASQGRSLAEHRSAGACLGSRAPDASPPRRRAATSARPRSSSRRRARASRPVYSLAATSLAVHAGISACDAICGARTGSTRAPAAITVKPSRSSSKRGAKARTRRALLTRLMPLKNRAEYEPQDVPKATATRAVDQAERIVQIAARSSRKTPSLPMSLPISRGHTKQIDGTRPDAADP